MAKNTVKTIEVRIVGPHTKSNIANYGIVAGTKLVVRLGTYPADPYAIKLETADGNEVGYVANQPKTAAGYPTATDVYANVSEGQVCEVVSTDPFLIAIPEKEGAKTSVTTLYTVLSGNKLEYPNVMKVKSDCRKASASGSTLKVDAKIDADTIVFTYDGAPCGIAAANITTTAKKTLAAKGIQVTETSDIVAAMKASKNTTAEIEFLDGMNFPVKISVEVEAEKAATAAPSKDYSKLLKAFEAADAEEVTKRINWLKSNNVAEYAIALFVKKMEGHKDIAPFEPCYIPHGKEVENAIAFSYAKGNLLLVGPAGSGKNMFITTFANLMDLNLIDKTCSAGVDEEGLYGYLSMKASEECPDADAVNAAFAAFIRAIADTKLDKEEFANSSVEEQIDAIKKNGGDVDYSVLFDAMRSQTAQIEFEPSILTKALEKPSLINLDEVNTLRPTVTSSLHSALDKRRNILINGYKNIEVNDDVIFTATMNEGAEYAGTSMLNLAFEDRWHVIEFEAPDNIAEILKQEVPTLSVKAIKILNELYKKLKSVRGVEIQERSFSQRAFIYAAQNIALGNDIKSAVMSTIVPKIRDVEDREAVKGIVDMMIK